MKHVTMLASIGLLACALASPAFASDSVAGCGSGKSAKNVSAYDVSADHNYMAASKVVKTSGVAGFYAGSTSFGYLLDKAKPVHIAQTDRIAGTAVSKGSDIDEPIKGAINNGVSGFAETT